MQKLLNEVHKAGLKLNAVETRVFCDLCGVAVVSGGLPNIGTRHLAGGVTVIVVPLATCTVCIGSIADGAKRKTSIMKEGRMRNSSL